MPVFGNQICGYEDVLSLGQGAQKKVPQSPSSLNGVLIDMEILDSNSD
jgi:hypothetical protein